MAEIPQTFRTSKIQKFIKKQVEFIEMQQQIIKESKEKGAITGLMEINQAARYNMIVDLCKEFNFEVPMIKGVK